MINAFYRIFADCFSELKVNQKQFNEMLDIDNCKLIAEYENDEIIGMAAVKNNCIRLLCVKPERQRCGTGSRLLKKCEALICSDGFDEAVLGGFDSQLFIGAVTSDEDFQRSDNIFFSKNGYKAERGCVEMKLELQGFDIEQYKPILNFSDDITYGFFNGDKADLIEAVAKVDDEWIQYFQACDVFCGWYKGELAGFCIVGYDDLCVLSGDGIKVGSVGCVGVIPEMRKYGIGLTMVALAIEQLKRHDCTVDFIHCTHLEKWYGKLGHETFMRYWFGHKSLN